MRHSKQYLRYQTRKHIRRKRNILKYVYRDDYASSIQGNYLNKGKVHCSCPMCATKTNRRKRSITTGWKHSDLINLAKGKG